MGSILRFAVSEAKVLNPFLPTGALFVSLHISMKSRDKLVIVCAQLKLKQKSIHFSIFFSQKIFFGRHNFAFMLSSLSADFVTKNIP